VAIAVLGALVVAGVLVLTAIAIAVGEEQRHHWRNDVVLAWHDAKTRDEVQARLGDPAFTTTITVGAHSASCDVHNAEDSAIGGWVQFSFCHGADGRRVASPDPLEPNDDVAYLRTYRLRPLTRPGKVSANIEARLDYWPKRQNYERLFDDEDVYRIWLPAQSALHIRVKPTADVALDVWNSSTPTVYLKGAARHRRLIAESNRAGASTEEVTLSRPRASAGYVFLDVYLLEGGPNHAQYHLTVKRGT
jgi:hypothetical protein